MSLQREEFNPEDDGKFSPEKNVSIFLKTNKLFDF